MKKLMIVAAVAAMTAGAFADCEIPESSNCAEVYDVVLNLKTTECKCKLITTTIKDACGIGGTTEECPAWRQVTTKKVQGVIFSCSCSCTEDVGGNVLDGNVYVPALWNQLTTDAMEGNQLFWIAKDKVVFGEDNLLTINWIAVIGKKNTQVEAAGTFGAGINVAGYGTFDSKNNRVKKISGYAAGTWGAPIDCSDPDQAEFCPAFDLCDVETAVADYTKTFAAGTWTVKYNSSKSKAIGKDVAKLWGKVVPNAVKNYKAAVAYVGK